MVEYVRVGRRDWLERRNMAGPVANTSGGLEDNIAVFVGSLTALSMENGLVGNFKYQTFSLQAGREQGQSVESDTRDYKT